MYNKYIKTSLLKTIQNKQVSYLSFITGNWLYRKLDLSSFENSVLLQNVLLRLVVAKRLENRENLVQAQVTNRQNIIKVSTSPFFHTNTGKRWHRLTTHPPYWRSLAVLYQPQNTQEGGTFKPDQYSLRSLEEYLDTLNTTCFNRERCSTALVNLFL